MTGSLLSYGPWVLAAAIQVLIGMLFLSAGVSKALRRPSLERMVHQHGLHHPLGVRLAGDAIILSEIAVGVLILCFWSPAAVMIGAVGGIALLIVFGGLSLRLALMNRPFLCRCSPLLASHTSGTAVAVRNLVLAAITALLFLPRVNPNWGTLWIGP
jgi:hypothetical protein